MAYIKQIERSGCVTFAPHASLLACGTAAGAIDLSFSSNSVLEIFPVDLTSQNEFHALGGAIPVHERFHRLAWGQKPSEALSLPMGVLAGGLADGSIYVWDPAVIAGDPAKTGKNPVLAKLQKHTGPVKGLQFNTFSPNLLASGASDGDLCIWDIANPAAPSLYPALKGATPTAPGRQEPEITHLAWNPRVQHILASTTSTGSTVVWDLKKQRPVLSFRDATSQRRCSVLHWHPEEARQLIVASDDDRSPTLQMWDLRNSAAPLLEFVGHTKGVLGMDWCPHDSSLLLSCGKDSRTICWDTATAEVVCELPTSNDWHVDVQWSPSTPGIFVASSYDSKVGFCNLATCTVAQMVETVNDDFTVTKTASGSTPLKRAPSWMKRPAGVAFGFGGRLVSFAHHKQQQQDATGQLRTVDATTISLRQVVSEQELVQHSEAFERAINGGDRTALKDFCATKAGGPVGSAEEAETWAFLSVLFEEDARRQLLQQLGFSDALAALPSADGDAAAGVDGVAAGMDGLHVADGASPLAAPIAEDPFASMNDESFFDNLAEQPEPPPPAAAPAADGPSDHPLSPTHAAEADGGDHPEAEADIQRALFVGNYELAVEACLKAGRWADALLVANTCSSDLYKKTMQRYMRATPRPYMRIIGAMVDNDFLSLVKTRPVGAWRETLATLATYTGPEQWMELCDALAARLASAGMLHPASLCYICAGNVEQAVAYWSRVTKSAGTVGVDVLQSVIEKAVIIGLATNNRQASGSLSDLVTSYATILACEGRVGTALEYLDLVPGEASSTVAVLRDRIYRCGVPGVPGAMNPPPFPFVQEEVQAAPQAAAPSYSNAGAAPYPNAGATQPQWNPQPVYGSYAPPSYPATTAYPTTVPAAPSQPPYHAPYPATTAHQPQPTAAPTYDHNTAAASWQSYPPQPGYGETAVAPGGGAPPANPIYAPPSNEGSVYTVTKRAAAPPQPSANSTSTYVTGAAAAPAAAAGPPSHQPSIFTPPPPIAPPPQTATVAPSATFAPVKGAPPPPMPVAPTNVPPPPISGNANSNYSGMMAPPQPPQQPPSPKPRAPPAPTGPPANTTIQTADTSKVPAELKPVVNTFTSLFNACMPAASNAVKKREMDDNSKRLGQLFWKLNAGEVSPAVALKLQQLCSALERADWAAASHVQVEMTTTNWDECGTWLSAVKRLIKTRQTLG